MIASMALPVWVKLLDDAAQIRDGPDKLQLAKKLTAGLLVYCTMAGSRTLNKVQLAKNHLDNDIHN